MYHCYETISNYYIQQTVHYKETAHLQVDEDTVVLSEEDNMLRMNNVLMILFCYLQNYRPEDDYILKIIRGDKSRGFGEFYNLQNTIVYRGEIKDGIPLGFGILYSPIGPYIEECMDFKAHGYGRIFDKERVLLYQGKFVDDLQEGYGIYYNEKGIKRYEAEWKGNKINGVGIEYYDNGVVCYMGMFKNNNREGYGTLYDQKGRKFIQGEFKNSIPDGFGMVFDERERIIYQGWLPHFFYAFNSLDNAIHRNK